MNWENYYFEQYDINFQYPQDWNIELVDKQLPGYKYPDSLPCTTQYLKSINSCGKQNVINAYQLNIYNKDNPTTMHGNILFTIVENQLLDTQRSTFTKSTITINNIEYEKYEYLDSQPTATSFHEIYIGKVNTGEKSIFKSFYINTTDHFTNKDQDTTSIMLEIIRTIK